MRMQSDIFPEGLPHLYPNSITQKGKVRMMTATTIEGDNVAINPMNVNYILERGATWTEIHMDGGAVAIVAESLGDVVDMWEASL